MTFFILRHTHLLGLWYSAVNMIGAKARALVDDGFGNLIQVNHDQCNASIRDMKEIF